MLKELRAANQARQRQWDPEELLDKLYFSNALAGEAGEVCNVVKKMIREEHKLTGSRAVVSDLAFELADVIIYADLLAAKCGIDLEEAVASKFNRVSISYDFLQRLTLPGEHRPNSPDKASESPAQ